jgi:FkbM family methyltransferase
LKKYLKKFLAYLSIEIILQNKKNRLLRSGLSENNAIIKDNRIFLKDFNIEIDLEKHDHIIKGLNYLYDFKIKFNAIITFKNETLIIHIDQLTYSVHTYEELFIINEIFVNGVYNVAINQNYEVIDVGMNVGFTSLFFAQKENCLGIHAYEPFKNTYEQAVANIGLNPGFKSKIQTFNYGLGISDKKMAVSYDFTIKGNMGIYGVPEYLIDDKQNLSIENIVIKNAAEIISPVIESIKRNRNKIVLKMDCEGSEYDIIESLTKANLLGFFDFIMIEWHLNGPESICETLKRSGLSFLLFNASGKTGMIYAFKNS